mgnify:CR=1 FL=1
MNNTEQIRKWDKMLRQGKDNAEISAGSIAVLLSGVADMYGVPVTFEMVAAGSGLLVAIGQRIKNAV